MQITRRILLLGGLGAVALPARADAAGAILRIGGPAFGSSWRATLPAGAAAAALQQHVQGILASVDACFSPYRADSALSRFNRAAPAQWQAVPPVCVALTRTALEIAAETGGFFDPTVGPLVAQQGFGPIAGRVGSYRDIAVERGHLRKAGPGITLDLCGIAKGHALDRVCAALWRAGLRHGVVEIGGEVRALGTHPEGRPWRVAVADPDRPGNARHVLHLRGLALATSGPAIQGLRGRVTASHIINPHRAAPAAPALRAVSVLAATATRADALATALCAAGPVRGPALARQGGIRALFLTDHATETTGGFDTHLLT